MPVSVDINETAKLGWLRGQGTYVDVYAPAFPKTISRYDVSSPNR